MRQPTATDEHTGTMPGWFKDIPAYADVILAGESIDFTITDGEQKMLDDLQWQAAAQKRVEQAATVIEKDQRRLEREELRRRRAGKGFRS